MSVSGLPLNCIQHLAQFLDATDMAALSKTDRHFRELMLRGKFPIILIELNERMQSRGHETTYLEYMAWTQASRCLGFEQKPLMAVESADLSNSHVTDEQLYELAINFPNLKKLNLTNCSYVTDNGLERIRWLSLNSLNLSNCNQFTHDVLGKLTRFWLKLESINLSGCRQFTDSDLKNLLSYIPDLKYLNISGCTEITNAGLKRLLLYPDLNKLVVDEFNQFIRRR